MDNKKFSWGFVIDTLQVESFIFKKYHPYKDNTYGVYPRPYNENITFYHIYVDGKDTNTSTHTIEGAMLVAISVKTLGNHTPGLDMIARALKLPEEF